MIKVLAGERYSGKTMELIKMAHENKALIVTSTNAMVEHIIHEASINGFDIPTPITFDAFIHNRGRRFPPVVFDNIDYCLGNYFCTTRILGFSIGEPVHSLLKNLRRKETQED